MDVLFSDEFGDWMRGLSKAEQKAVWNAVDRLRVVGLGLGFPHSAAIVGSNIGLRELRPKRGDSPLRVLYALSPARDVVVLCGGSKAEEKRLYERLIPLAESIFQRFLRGEE